MYERSITHESLPARLRGLALGLLAGLAVAATAPASAADRPLTVYTESNAATGNALLVFTLGETGPLRFTTSVPTQGTGSGGGLSNQGALALAPRGELLFAVNAASNTISAFRLDGDTPQLIGITPAGGYTPVSLSIHDELLYVLNQGSDAITGFRIGEDGTLTPLAGSTQALSGAGVVGVEVSFSAGGDYLVATEKQGGLIDVFPVADGIAQRAWSQPSIGAVPFGFSLDRHDRLIVSEAAASTVSSYELNTDSGRLSVISASVPTHQGAACWVAETPNDRYAFTANAASGSVSAFSIDHAGRLNELGTALIHAGAHTTDLAASANSRHLFALSDTLGTISGFVIGADGTLAALPAMAAQAQLAAATGLVVR